jgi:hypothetical protein
VFDGARGRMVSLALEAVGLGAADPGPYLDLVGAGESDAMRTAMLTMSGCGLTVRGLWRELGMSDPRLEAPYQPGSVITNLVAMAKEAGAWNDGASGLPELAAGDVIYVSEPDHVGTVVAVERKGDGGVTMTTVDGGSRDANGRQIVVKWDRAIGADGTVTAGPMAGEGRKLLGSISLPKVAAMFGASGSGEGDTLLSLALILGGAALVRRIFRRRA